MREMKDSGHEYIGLIPINWSIKRIKDIYSFDTGFTPSTEIQSNYNDENGYEWATISDINGGLINKPTKSLISRSFISSSHKKQCPVGSLLYSFKLSVGQTAIVDRPVFTNEALACFYNTNGVNLRFLKYASCLIEHNANINIYGARILNQDLIKNAPIVCPPIDEQKRIAAYLDGQCKKIDEIMADIQSQFDTLENYRKSVISEAVTQGLNPNVEMKETDMGWIKQVPAKWNISRIASVYELRNEKVSDKDYQPLSVTMKGVLPQLDTVAKSDAHDDRKLVRKGDFAINSRSDRRGSCGIAPCDGSISLINTVLCPLTNMNPIYYNWLFHTTEFADEFYKWGHGIVDDLWTTGWQEMKNILIPVPPVQEQEKIAKYLNKKCADIDSIIEDKKAQFETIENYKKSLIYEYVTGKKEVPENE